MIFRTSDAGATWIRQYGGGSDRLMGVSFVDASLGTIVGHRGVILRTTDGGTTWAQDTSMTKIPLWGVFVTSDNVATAVGEFGTILRNDQSAATIPQTIRSSRSMDRWRLARIYPNPAATSALSIEIQALAAATVSIRIVSLTGEVVLRRGDIALHEGSNLIEVPLSIVESSGACQLIMESAEGQRSLPLVIQR